MHNNNRLKRYTLLILFFNYVAHIHGMDTRNQKSNLKIIRHPNGKTVFCLPIMPNQQDRAGFVINKESCPYTLVGTFPGARYRECVEHALFDKDGKYFVFVTGAQYKAADTFMKNVFVIDTATLQTVDIILYQNIVSTKVSMSDDSRYLIVPRTQGGLFQYDVVRHGHI